MSIERRGPSASLRFAQDDGVLVVREKNYPGKSKSGIRAFLDESSIGFGGVDTFEVLRLRCASLRMTGVLGGLEIDKTAAGVMVVGVGEAGDVT